MLPRQANNTTKYELKRKSSVDEDNHPKLTGMAAIQNKIDAKNQLERPHTAASNKLIKPIKKSGIPTLSGSKEVGRTKARTDAVPPEPAHVDHDRIKNLLRNNPNGAAAVLKRETDGITSTTVEYSSANTQSNPANNAAKKLDKSIKDAYKLRMNRFEDSQSSEIVLNSKPANSNNKLGASLKGPKSPMTQLQSPKPPVGEDENFSSFNLEELKMQHERLVDLILKEEDDLIATHHKSINNTINSVKEQEQLRYNVDLPGSDVEEYILSLDRILSEKLSEAEHLHRLIQDFHKHIKQEQALSQKFYSMQEEDQADLGAEFDD